MIFPVFRIERVGGPASPEEMKWLDSIIRLALNDLRSHWFIRPARRFLSNSDFSQEPTRFTSFQLILHSTFSANAGWNRPRGNISEPVAAKYLVNIRLPVFMAV